MLNQPVNVGRSPRPPGPRGRWLSGSLKELRRDRLAFWTHLARTYGDVAAVRLGSRRLMLVSHPDAIEEVLVSKARHFTKHFALRLNPLVLGKGLLTSEGDFWLRQRRLIQPAFQRKQLTGFGPMMAAYTRRLLDGWRDGEVRDILPEMMRLTLEIIAKALFDAEVVDKAREVGEAMQCLQENFLARFNCLVPPPLWLPLPANLRLRRAVRRLDDIIYGFIRQRRQAGDQGRTDVLSLLLHARDEIDRTGMTDKQLRDEAMTLFLAGHETTALALSWTWALLGSHPEAEAQLHAEVDAVLAGREPTVDDLPRLRFTEAVLLEALRLYPPAYVIGREAADDCEVAGYPVPRGMTFLMSQWVVHRDERFFEAADQFRPQRWLGDLPHRLPKYAYFPFGGGPRLCIGNTFAMLEAVLVLATLAGRLHFRLAPGHTVAPWPTFTLRPKNGVWAVLARRHSGG
jgi:cytochrome P450